MQPAPPGTPHPTGPERLRFGRIAQTLIHAMPLGVIVFDEDLRVTDSSPPARDLFALDGNLPDALADARIDDDATWTDRLRTLLASTATAIYDHVAYSRNGRSYDLRILLTPLPAEDSSPTPGGILLVEDMTHRRAMEQDLASAERLAAVGRLAARVAHELNNPLDGILRYLNLALRVARNTEEESLLHYLQESRKGLLRMVQIISELLEFSRSTYSAFQEADINKIVEDAVKAMDHWTTDRNVQVIRHYGENLPNVRSGNLFQVFCNLIKNAADAMESGGRLEITTRRDHQHLIITFDDTGPGIPHAVMEKLFEAFFTTKAPGKGTGLGLAICKDIVARYGGRIIPENRSPAGARFTVQIPLERTSQTENDTTHT